MSFTVSSANSMEIDFVLPNLRNGRLEDISPVVPRACIDPEFYWVSIGDVPDARKVAFIPARAKVTFAYMKNTNPTISDDLARSQAIVMASIRTGAEVAWKLLGSDLSQGEVAGSFAIYRPASAEVPEVPAVGTTARVPAVPAVEEGVTSNLQGATATAINALLASFVNFTADEKALAGACFMYGMVIPVNQGWSLIKFNHHVLTKGGSSTYTQWASTERQWISKSPASVKTFVETNKEWWANIAYHKACHPILMSLKMEIASRPTIKAMLTAANFGSAAIRLPATPPELEFAKVTIALFECMGPTMLSLGVDLDITRLADLVEKATVELDFKTKANLVAAATHLAHTQDANVAFAAGLLDAASEIGGGDEHTVLRSMGLKRVCTTNTGLFASGKTSYKAFNEVQRDAILKGIKLRLTVNL